MQRKTAALLVLVMLAFALLGCAAQDPVVGKWQDENKLVTFEFEKDGTGTLYVYIAMFNSTTKNEIEYTCEGNTVKWRFAGGTEDYSEMTMDGDTMEYEEFNVVLIKQ